MNTINIYNTSESKYSVRLGNKALYTNINNNPGSLYKQTRYFSGVDAEIYFGETYIDEAVNINFSLQQNTMPIFGYNSYIFDTCAQGSRLIQGSFTVNFTRSCYMYDVLNTLSVVNSGATLSSINHACNNQYPSKSTKAAMWDKCFDIAIAYGNVKVSEGSMPKPLDVDLSTMVILRGVYLTGCEQEFGTSQPNGKGAATGGIPLYETYYFYARDIEYEYSNAPNLNPKPENYESDISIVNKKDIELEDYEPILIVANHDSGSFDIVCNYNYDPDVVIVDATPISILYKDNKKSLQSGIYMTPVPESSTNNPSNSRIHECAINHVDKDSKLFEILFKNQRKTLYVNSVKFYYNKAGSDQMFYVEFVYENEINIPTLI